MIPIISKVIQLITKYNKILAVTIILILSAIFVLQRKQLNNKQNEINRLQNNIEYYKNANSQQNIVLQLTKDEFKHTEDSLINELKTIQKKLKIKDKDVQQAQVQKQVIKYDTTLVIKDKDFYREIKPNKLTSIIINKTDSVLTTKLEIRNTQTLIITDKKQYKRKYKNWLARLFHFDFRKQHIKNYQIHNSNDLITVDKTVLVEIP